MIPEDFFFGFKDLPRIEIGLSSAFSSPKRELKESALAEQKANRSDYAW